MHGKQNLKDRSLMITARAVHRQKWQSLRNVFFVRSACFGKPLVLAANGEPTFFQDPQRGETVNGLVLRAEEIGVLIAYLPFDITADTWLLYLGDRLVCQHVLICIGVISKTVDI